MLYIFNRNDRVHISWNSTEKRSNRAEDNRSRSLLSRVSVVWRGSAG
ncbi:hypothetical protein FHU14_001499 [Mesorhizobium sp. RMAD-H1]|nr:hypothetical protein [Mesorhizobium sp. RMAD-H1]